MNILFFLFVLEMGWTPFGGESIATPIGRETEFYEDQFYTQLEVEVQILKYFFVGGLVKTLIEKCAKGYCFFPRQSSYLFEAGIRFDKIELGFRHLCIHPTVPYHAIYTPTVYFDGGYEEFYIRFTNE